MQIESITISKDVFDSLGVGLPTLPMDPPIRLTGLGQCVVLAGKNGSGKTRLLTLLDDLAEKYVTPEACLRAEYELSGLVQGEQDAAANLQRLQSEGGNEPTLAGQISEAQRAVASFRSEIDRRQQTLRVASALVANGSGLPKVVFFVPKSTDLVDPSTGLEQETIQQARMFADALAAEGAQRGAPAYARAVMRAATNERGARQPGTSTEKNDAERALLDLLSNLLGSSVNFELNDTMNLKLEGLTDRYQSLLSDGQKILFQLACMLHARQASLGDCIVLLDEPENHLHPAVLNEVIDRIRGVLRDGQLWIATHSVPLIAHLVATDPDCLWFADEGRFSKAGRAPSKVLNSLLGGREGASRVNELTLLASQYASFLLLRQCLLPPGVIGYGEADPQLQQIREVLGRQRIAGQPLAILDFGAGKGRLLEAIADASHSQPLGSLVDYVAFEPSRHEADQCQARCESLFGGDSTRRTFRSLDSILASKGEKFANVVVVCNVLHEVHPDEWLRTFGPESTLARLISDDGIVLFVEDYAIPVGERAHEYGFLLLDEPELRRLFDISDDDMAAGHFNRNDHAAPAYRGRLIAHAVSAKCMARVSEQSRWRAIQSLNSRSLDRLQSLLAHPHDGAKSAGFGRESALVTQLVANSALWLRKHPSPSPP